MTEAERFYKKYYTPGNITIGIAGDVNPADAKKMAEKYFGRLPKAPLPPMVRTVEPVQEGEKRVAVESPAQPFLVVAYKRPSQYSPDDASLDVLSDILSGGRTGLIYKELVRDKKIALGGGEPGYVSFGQVSGAVFVLRDSVDGSFAGGEREGAVLDYRAGEEGQSGRCDDRAGADEAEGGVDPEAGQQFWVWRRSCAATPSISATGESCLRELEEYNKVTADDVLRVAKKYLMQNSRTVAYTVGSGGRSGEMKSLLLSILPRGRCFCAADGSLL